MFQQPRQVCSLCSQFRSTIVDGLCVGCRRIACPHPDPTVVGVRKVNGTLDLHLRCHACDSRLRGVKNSEVADLNAVPIHRDHRGGNPPCARCGKADTELHHFAPRALFGFDEAELWPTAYLCPPCHRTWHTTMRRDARRSA